MAGRGCAICTTIWALILASIYLALAVMAYLAYRCEIDMSGPIGMVLDTMYFYNENCSEAAFDIPLVTVTVPVDDLPIGEPIELIFNISLTFGDIPTKMTQAWTMSYMILSSLWIFTSLILLISSCFKSTGCCLFFAVFPWILTTLANLFGDVAATIMYALEMYKTWDFYALLTYLQVQVKATLIGDQTEGIDIPNIDELVDKAVEEFKSTDVPFTWVPSAFMTLIVSRGVFIPWLITLILMIAVIVEAVRAKKKVAPHILQNYPNNIEPYNNSQNHLARNQVLQTAYVNEKNNQSIPVTPVMTVDKLNSKPDNITSSNIESCSPSPPESSWLARKNNTQVVEKPSTLKKGFENRMNNPPPVSNEELRSQLPWSYTQDRNEAPIQLRQSYIDEAPPVPVPDYTLHFPKRNREDPGRGILKY